VSQCKTHESEERESEIEREREREKERERERERWGAALAEHWRQVNPDDLLGRDVVLEAFGRGKRPAATSTNWLTELVSWTWTATDSNLQNER
jgi:predicted TPR repeat methyltransferase